MFNLFKNKRSVLAKQKVESPTVIVCGSSLSSMVAVLAAKKNGLNTHWVTPTLSFTGTESVLADNQVFDSLAPEGVRYLNHILSRAQIDKVSVGHFAGVDRNGDYTSFDRYLGSGLQVHTTKLKALLYQDIICENDNSEVCIHQDSAIAVSSESEAVDNHLNSTRLSLASGKQLFADWVIDGQGEYSQLPKHSANRLSADIWIERYAGTNHDKINYCSFSSDESGWRWLAVDAAGRSCITQWHSPYRSINKHVDKDWLNNSESNNKKNCYWYRRQHAYEDRLLLIGLTALRMDPSLGLGMTLQISSALQAVQHITEQNKHYKLIVNSYQNMMDNRFESVFQPLKQFYQQYQLAFY